MNEYNDDYQRYSAVDLFSTQGRIGRRMYFFYSIAIPFALFWIFGSVAGLLAKVGGSTTKLSYLLLGLAFLSVLFTVVRLTIQRCHDFNVSGKIAILAIIPFANIMFALIPGDNGLNSYGEAPEPASKFITLAVAFMGSLLVLSGIYSLLLLFNINLLTI